MMAQFEASFALAESEGLEGSVQTGVLLGASLGLAENEGLPALMYEVGEHRVLHASSETVLVDSDAGEHRVKQASGEVVRTSDHDDQHRIKHFSAEAVIYKPRPPSWLPRYLFDGHYWVPLFSTIGTPHEARDRPWGEDEPFAMRAPDGSRWHLMVDPDGSLRTEQIFEPSIEFISSSSASLAGSTAGAVSIPKPQNTRPGNLLVAQVFHRTSGGCTPPGGWTLLRRDANPANSQWQDIWLRVAGASEPDSYTWTNGGARIGGGMVNIHNVAPEGSIEVEDSAYRATGGGNHAAPSVTSQGEDRILLGFSHCLNAGGISEGGWSGSPLFGLYGSANSHRGVARWGRVFEEGPTGTFSWTHQLLCLIPCNNHNGGTTSVLLRAGA